MARKSRKQNSQHKPVKVESSFIQTAAYVRLSMDDVAHKGDSIETQKRIISNYIDDHPDFELCDTYVDSGVSGTTFERPNFQRMIRDIETGKIKCVIVKDLSRLGRNVIDTGYYVERIFLQLGIRLISISDNYDSAADNDNFKLPLINLLNEAYAIDIGRKTKSQARQSMKDGVYVGGQPPYGYIRSPENRRKLVIDEPAAEIVKRIFDWAADGVSCYEITRRLNSMKTPSPSTYKYEQRPAKKENDVGSGLWHARTVERILANEIYCGRLVQGKTEVVEFRRKLAPAAEWITATEAHEAIISSEIFETVRLLKGKNRSPQREIQGSYSPHIFKGKMYCAHCGKPLERTKNNGRYVFRCTTNRVSPDLCKGNRISEGVVQRTLIEQLIQYREALLSSLDSQFTEADISPELSWIEMELLYMQNVTRSLYEDLINGVLDQQEYMELRSGFQGKAYDLRQRATTLKQALEDEKRIRESIHILNMLANTQALTRENIDRFVNRILVFRDGKMRVAFFVNGTTEL